MSTYLIFGGKEGLGFKLRASSEFLYKTPVIDKDFDSGL
jgi:hypothetical protein